MPTYKTPNVYVEEVSTLPPSVVPVSTAVPAFIGCTEKAGDNGEYAGKPIRISSLLDYTTYFGGAHATNFTVTLNAEQQISQIAADSGSDTPTYLMYYALRMFFDNGGGSCYIVSVGGYTQAPSKQNFLDGIAAIRKEDEPTLLLLTDAIHLSKIDYYSLCQSALKQCNDLKDRFAIFDILDSDVTTNGIGDSFRNGIGNEYLKYGATYYPYLQSAIAHHYTETSVTISGLESTDTDSATTGEYRTAGDELVITYSGPQSNNPQVTITTYATRTTTEVDVVSGVLTIRIPNDGASVADIIAAATDIAPFSIAAGDEDSTVVTPSLETTPLIYASEDAGTHLGSTALKVDHTALYNEIKAALNNQRVVMPPSSAVAGVYAKVDRERGVWKAPANVSLASVIGPTVKINNEEQEALNVDATAGKSINAIRSFTGKGTLIWGSRTLAGNDNEWRYIPVRRLFNLIEESIQKATAFAVFEPNNTITWLKIKTIVESYLDGLLRQGALAGTSQAEAFFVKVGLGQTMTEQDILEGRMIVEIGISAVRPAEFIILRFSHKLQQA